MTTKKLTKLLALYLPYILLGLVATNFGEAWRLAEGKELGDKIMSMMGTIPVAFANPLPSLHPLDLLVGLCCGAGLRLAVYLRGKNAKKYRHGMEYGSARWGTPKDIEPFMAPKFADNIILTKTERLMMSNRPPDPKNARNKNVLVVGGSGSGKTRFWLKPNLLQCHSSYVVTDPKGSIVLECGNAMLKNGYKVRILNTINFKKSMHYNPFAYVHSEKDILKLVTTLMTNTKGEGSGGDPFWEKSERLLLTALIAYLHAGQDIPLLIGSNLNEWTGFYCTSTDGVDTDALSAALKTAYPDKTDLTADHVDTLIRLPILKTMSHKADQNGAPVYAYLLTYGSSNHGAEIPYIFRHSDVSAMNDLFSSIWVNFARSGVPSADSLPTWEPYTREGGATMLLDTTSQLVYHHDAALLKLLAPDYEY